MNYPEDRRCHSPFSLLCVEVRKWNYKRKGNVEAKGEKPTDEFDLERVRVWAEENQ
jgi:hypothetical protein